MRRAGSLEARRIAAKDWAASWRADHSETLRRLEQALSAGNVAEAGRWCGQLKTLHGKALDALPRVIEALADEDIL